MQSEAKAFKVESQFWGGVSHVSRSVMTGACSDA